MVLPLLGKGILVPRARQIGSKLHRREGKFLPGVKGSSVAPRMFGWAIEKCGFRNKTKRES